MTLSKELVMHCPGKGSPGAAVILLSLLAMPAVRAEKNLGAIMPLGDSITKGAPAGAYRDPLCTLLTGGGYTFRFVGTLTENPSAALAAAGQEYHEGHSGMGMDWIRGRLPECFASNRPDRILLAIGANDIGGATLPELQRRMELLVTDICTRLPKVQLYLATVTPQTGPAMTKIRAFNELLPDLVVRQRAQGRAVVLVSMAALNLKDLEDNVHPNVAGSRKMAEAWYAALTGAPPAAVTDPAVPADDLARMRQAAPDAAPAPPARPRRLLVFTLAKGYVHEATPWGVAALRCVGEKSGAYTMEASAVPEVFARESLARFDTVCFLNTCDTPFTNAVLRQNLMDFVKGGKGYVGIHCAAHTFLDWPEFGALQGAYSVSHPWHERVAVTIEEPEHPLMRCFGGAAWAVADEIYLFDQRYSRQRLRVLASLDTRRTDMTKPGITRTDGDFGLVWIQRFGRGRAFYSAFGHDKDLFWNPMLLRHYLAGIQFAFGDLAADAAPRLPPPGQPADKP